MSGSYRGVLVLMVCLWARPLLAADPAADLAIRARTILKKHCAECHDDQVGSRSKLVLLDHPKLLDASRTLPAFVKPKAPRISLIVEFMEDGSMPPGDRPKVSAADLATVAAWIEAGASAFPRRFDDAFVQARIWADIEAAREPERKFYRYLSLHQLLDEEAPVDLPKQRDALRKAINSTAKKEIDGLKPIDPTETVFRYDLRETGWDETPFRLLDRQGKNLPSQWNIFDLLLLEYPFGEMPIASDEAERLAALWLRPSAQVRPVTYVRGDWFAKVLDDTPLKNDINRLLSISPKARGFNAPDKKRFDFRPENLPNITIRPPARALPIVPIDAWYLNDYEPKPPAPKVDVSIMDAAGKVSTRFKPGDRLKMEIRSTETVFIELIQIDADGAIFAHDLGPASRVQAGVPKEVEFDGKKDGLLLGDEVGKQRFIIFAAVEKFSTGDLIQSKNEVLPIERYVHPFYDLPKKLGDPLKFDPAKMVRRTAVIDVAK